MVLKQLATFSRNQRRSPRSDPLFLLRIGHPLAWLIPSLVIVLALGMWGVLFPEGRASQISINLFLRDNGNVVLDALARVVDFVFSPTAATALTIVLAVLIGMVRKSLMAAAGFALAVLLAWLPVEILKFVFHQSRPVDIQILEGIGAVNPQSSFPSGHVGFAIGISYALLLVVRPGRARGSIIAGLTALVMIVAYTRLYAGVHYLSDTVGSVFASAVGILVFTQLWPLVVTAKSPHSSAT